MHFRALPKIVDVNALWHPFGFMKAVEGLKMRPFTHTLASNFLIILKPFRLATFGMPKQATLSKIRCIEHNNQNVHPSHAFWLFWPQNCETSPTTLRFCSLVLVLSTLYVFFHVFETGTPNACTGTHFGLIFIFERL
jgi:hypothetical protein